MAWVAAVVGIVKGAFDSSREGAERTAAGQNNMLMALYRAQNTTTPAPTAESQSGSNSGATNATSPAEIDQARGIT